jgi:hypothetical protein
MEYYRPLVPEISEVVAKIRPGQVVHVGSIR